jgi:hypothetical protein
MKRAFCTGVLLLLAVCNTAVQCHAAQRNIEQMKGAAERASGGQQAKLYAELARELVGVADQQFSQGEVQQAHATVQDVVLYSSRARDSSVKSHGKIKDTEIILRETQRKLEALKRTLALEDRPAVETAEKKVEQFRQDLLDAMFSPKKKEGKS